MTNKPLPLTALSLAAALALGACASTGTSGAVSDAGGTAVETTVDAQSGSTTDGELADTANPPGAAEVLAADATSSRVGDDEWEVADAQDVTLTGSGATTSASGVSV